MSRREHEQEESDQGSVRVENEGAIAKRARERLRRERGSDREESEGAIAKRARERSRREREKESKGAIAKRVGKRDPRERGTIDREKMRRVFKQAFWCRGCQISREVRSGMTAAA